jgi:hypothetical protein
MSGVAMRLQALFSRHGLPRSVCNARCTAACSIAATISIRRNRCTHHKCHAAGAAPHTAFMLVRQPHIALSEDKN